MSMVKVNEELWNTVSEKKVKDITSRLDLEIIKDSKAPIPKPEDIVYGMTIEEAATLLAKEDKSEFISRVNADAEIEKMINSSIKKRSTIVPYIIDALSKKDVVREKCIDLNEEEKILFEEIKGELEKRSRVAGGEKLLYGATVGDVSYNRNYGLPVGGANCICKCIQSNGGFYCYLECI